MSRYDRAQPRTGSPTADFHTRDAPRVSRSHRKRDRSYSPDRDRDIRPRKRRSMTPSSEDDRSNHRNRRRSPRRSRHHDRSQSRSRSPIRSRSRSPPRSPKPFQRSRGPLPSQNKAFDKERGTDPSAPEKPKEKPNFAPTGKLAAASNTIQTANQTIVLKYHEPSEARKPPANSPWRMYVFKNGDIVDTIGLFEQSCWLFGRELAVADIPVEHPSCSKQHAVVQFRFVEKRNEFGDKIGRVKPYVLDLESANGTYVNGERVEAARYVEVRDGDVLKFGHSRREYVVQLPKG